MFSTTSTARRRLARVVVAGAIAAVPLTALAVPASADSSPGVSEVRHNRHYPGHNCDFGPFQNWSCNNNPFFGWWDGPGDHGRPPGLFGSS